MQNFLSLGYTFCVLLTVSANFPPDNPRICLKRDSNLHHASPRQESQRLRPLGHEGLIVISGLMYYAYMHAHNHVAPPDFLA